MTMRWNVLGAAWLALALGACGGGEDAARQAGAARSPATAALDDAALDLDADLGPPGKEVAAAAASRYASLPVSLTVTGSGNVSSTPAGITCGITGSDCSESYTRLTKVKLQAVAAKGAAFKGWSGDCRGTSPTCTIYNDRARNVTATFTTIALPTQTLSASVSGTGTVVSHPAGLQCGSSGTACVAGFSQGTAVTLTATPGSGQVFKAWGGACLGTATCTVVMNQARSVSATFAAAPAGGGGTGGGTPTAPAAVPTTQLDAVRLADQASFGPTEALVTEIRTKGAARWIHDQLGATRSQYTSGGTGAVHQYTGSGNFCDGRGDNCWRDWSSSIPLAWDFYRNAVTRPDQLRQRVAFALQQVLVASNLEVDGTYGLRNYHNAFLDNAFGNYRDVLRKVALSPVMGDYLNNANNDKAAPNENFARELLQLFAIGTCQLNADGSLKGGSCQPTYDNAKVREYAYALTGWTYPAGGATPWGCWPKGTNCRYYGGDMVPVAALHDTQARSLLNGASLPAGHTAAQALDAVLDSLMQHPNMAPFIGKQLIQHLVTSNPSPAYVQRVATAFTSGRFQTFGQGRTGDLAATVAAILLDSEARTASAGSTAGRLREPVQLFTGVLRALNGQTDGDALSWWWGDTMRQHVFRPPSVFNFYPPDYPVPRTALVGPAFGIHNANTALQRMNYVNYLLFWNGSAPNAGVPNAVGTRVNLSAFQADAADPARLVDRISLLALGQPLAPAARQQVITAVSAYNQNTDRNNYIVNRVRTAAYLVFAAPQYHVIR